MRKLRYEESAHDLSTLCLDRRNAAKCLKIMHYHANRVLSLSKCDNSGQYGCPKMNRFTYLSSIVRRLLSTFFFIQAAITEL